MNLELERLKATSSLASVDSQLQISQWAINKVTKGVANTTYDLYQNTGLYSYVSKVAQILKKVNVYIVDEDSQLENVLTQNLYKFPITPDQINFKDDYTIEEVETIAGKINYIKDIDIREINFRSIFPAVYYPFSEDYSKFDWACVKSIEGIRAKNKSVKLVITGLGIVFRCYIERFNKNSTGEGDIEFIISFVEAKDHKSYETESKYSQFKPKEFSS